MSQIENKYKKKNIFDQQYLYLNSQKDVSEIIDLICQKGAEILYDKYLVDKWPEYLGEDIMHWCNGVVSQKQIITDKGESKIILQHKWVPELEPTPALLDNQARCSIKVEIKEEPENFGQDDETKSVQSQSSLGLSGRFTVTSSRVIGGKKSKSKFKQSMISIKNQSILGSKDITDDERSNQISRIPSYTDEQYDVKPTRTQEERQPSPVDTVTEKLRDTRDKNEKERQQKRQVQQIQDQKDYEAKLKQKELQKQLKHKNVTYDTNGDIIHIKAKQYNFPGQQEIQIPQDGYGLEYKNPNKKPGDIERLPKLKDKDGTAKPAMIVNEFINKKPQKKGKKVESPKMQEFHKQPNLVEFLTVKTGVNVTFQNGFKKEGGVIEYENKMRKDEYREMIENQPNRPVPQYLQQQQDFLQVPGQTEMEQKIKDRLKDYRKRPQTAGSSYYEPQGIQIEEQDLYIEMMAEEKLQANPSMLQNNQSRMSGMQRSQRRSFFDKSQMDSVRKTFMEQKQKRSRPQTGENYNYIKQYKKKVYGNKGEEEIAYDLGIQDLKESQMTKIQEESSEYNDNIARMRQKVNKFDKQIRQNKQWGQVEYESQNNLKKKINVTSYNRIKPQSANLNASKSTRVLSGKYQNFMGDQSMSNLGISKLSTKPQSAAKYNNKNRSKNTSKVITRVPEEGEKNRPLTAVNKKQEYQRIQSAKQ